MSMLELSAVARAVADESALAPAVRTLEREVCRMLDAADAMFVMFDWARRTARTLHHDVSPQLADLVAEVAGSGGKLAIKHVLVMPIGPAPARAVLVVRRAPGTQFERQDVQLASALVGSVARTLDRMLSAHP